MSGAPTWRQAVDLAAVEWGVLGVELLLRIAATAGASLPIRVDGERREGAHPSIFTVVVTTPAGDSTAWSARFDDADLMRAVSAAITTFDLRLPRWATHRPTACGTACGTAYGTAYGTAQSPARA